MIINCTLTKEQLQEALDALNIAHDNGWIKSKAIFELQTFDKKSGNLVWEIAKDDFRNEVELIVDAGSERGELNYGRSTYTYKDYTPKSIKEQNDEEEK